jgi:hypothetical protein
MVFQEPELSAVHHAIRRLRWLDQRVDPTYQGTSSACFHRFRTVVFIETDRPCSRKPDSRFHDFDHLFSSWTAHVKGELGV